MPRPKPPKGGSHDILPPLSEAELAEFERGGGVTIVDVDEPWGVSEAPPEPPQPPEPNQPKLAEDAKVLEGVLEAPPPKGQVTYESRITIVDAFQYPGNVVNAPEWIDRNWIGYGDYDELRGIEAGPCLRVPNPADPSQVILARIGDYVARQSVVLDQASSPIMRIDVWAREQFQKLFIPVAPGAARTNPLTSEIRSTPQRKREVADAFPVADLSS